MKCIATIIFTLLIVDTFGQHPLWTKLSDKPGFEKFESIRSVHVGLDKDLLLAKFDRPNFDIDIPYPDGEFEVYTVKEASIMQPELQSSFPNIRTFKGVNSSGDVLRLDLTPQGFHAIAFTKEGTVYVDPAKTGSDSYVSYYRLDYKKAAQKTFIEQWEREPHKLHQRKLSRISSLRSRINGTELKSYRIAIAADNQYTAFHGGTVEGALAAIVTTLNRVAGIYENELSITFVLVNNNDAIIYTEANTDPYNGLGSQAALEENQANLDNIIGIANYDLGHVFTTGSGGLAGLGVVCKDGSKARGTTGTNEPIGDPFDVDFVAHEIGHQFGANHTFNGTAGNCTGGNRNAATAYEPGSGSTIMAYAGICGSDNIQNNSDPYFHAISLEEILEYVSEENGASCPDIVETGNTPPEVAAPVGGFSIPVNTPFFLVASGSDADGDDLTYAWEQFDLGDAGSPSNPAQTAPLFRSVSPAASPIRYFPRLEDVVNGTTTFGEILPDRSRELNFSVTVRDNNPNGGGVNSDDISFNVSEEAGPFMVTSQSRSETFAGGSSQLVTWEVANTNNFPLGVDSVTILISLDGGVTFSDTLIHSTLNDGSAFVTIPNQNVSDARIMVAALGNIFFNVNNTGFGIQENVEADFDLILSEIPALSCESEVALSIEAVPINGFADIINLSFSSNDMVTFNPETTTIATGEQVMFTVTNHGELGEKIITIAGTSQSLSKEVTTGIEYLAGIDQTPLVIYPENEAIGIELRPTFSWNAVDDATGYTFILALDQAFDNILIENANQSATTYSLISDLDVDTPYYWRVSAVNECGDGIFNDLQFTTVDISEVEYLAENVPVSIFDESTVTSSITIAENVSIYDVKVSGLDITHTWVQDLTITLTSPTGNTVTLFDQACGDDDDIFLTFDDGASSDIMCPPNDGGVYKPVEPLSSFLGESSQGDWVLSVNDAFNEDQGTINSWGMVIVWENDLRLSASPSSSSQVDLRWNNLLNNQGYEIEQVLDGEFSKMLEVGANVNETIISGLDASTGYSFRVRAIVDEGFSEYSNVANVTTFSPPPAAPSDLTASKGGSEEIVISWADNSDSEEGFIIERSVNGGSFSLLNTTLMDETSYIDGAIEAGIEYFYQVMAFNDGGNSEPSNIASFLILGLEEISHGIYPNPAQDHILISSDISFNEIRIVDLLGRTVIYVEAGSSGDSSVIDIRSLPQGTYIVQILDGVQQRNVSLIKK